MFCPMMGMLPLSGLSPKTELPAGISHAVQFMGIQFNPLHGSHQVTPQVLQGRMIFTCQVVFPEVGVERHQLVDEGC